MILIVIPIHSPIPYPHTLLPQYDPGPLPFPVKYHPRSLHPLPSTIIIHGPHLLANDHPRLIPDKPRYTPRAYSPYISRWTSSKASIFYAFLPPTIDVLTLIDPPTTHDDDFQFHLFFLRLFICCLYFLINKVTLSLSLYLDKKKSTTHTVLLDSLLIVSSVR